MAEAHLFSKVVVSGDVVEVYTFSKGIRCGHERGYEIVRRSGSTVDHEDDLQKREDNLYRARQRIRRLIWANQTKYTKFLTLTYAKTELDIDKVQRDIKTFVQRMRRHGYDMKYVYVLEHQRSRGLKEGNDGCLHVHMLIFNDEKIDLDMLNECWGHGNTDISALKDVKNVGAYVCKYITKDTLAAFNKKVFSCSRGLNRGKVENFYTEGYSDHRYDGLHPDDIIKSLDVEFSSKMHHSYLDENGIGQEQVVNYYQGKFKDDLNVITESEEYEIL